jgi:hypothetical protein
VTLLARTVRVVPPDCRIESEVADGTAVALQPTVSESLVVPVIVMPVFVAGTVNGPVKVPLQTLTVPPGAMLLIATCRVA